MHSIINKAQIFLDQIIETADVQQHNQDNLSLQELTQCWKSLQLNKGSVVLLLFTNSKALLKQVFSLLAAGYVPALVAPSTPVSRVNVIAKNFNAKAIIKHKFFTNSVENINYLTKIDGCDVAILNNLMELITHPNELILTTSGTSGFSSGCIFDFSSLLNNAEKHADVIGLNNKDIVLVNLPLFYSYAFVAQALASFIRNAQLVISSPPFNYARYLADIEKYSITISSITPLLVKELLSHSIKFPVCLRALTVGGDALDVQYIEKLLNHALKKELYLTYGITEAGPRVATLAAHAVPTKKLSSTGLLLPRTYVQLDKTNYENNHGELLIHSDTLVKSSLGNSTKQLFENIEGQKWLKTGDIFSIDEDGYLYYKSRISDFVILNGEKVNLSSIKKLAISQFNALSAKVNFIKDAKGLVGYSLDILVNKDFDKNIEKIKQDFHKHLKIFERPKNIEISLYGENSVERYK